MSTERLPFGFNSLIPETYKTKAEAFAKCLQHKLLSLGRIETPSDSYSGGTRRLSNENKQEVNEEKTDPVEKTDDSDEEFCSHSESENGDGGTKQKLTTMSSEDSTVESWSSCQENLTDFEKFDSETEDSNSLAAQIRGSPKLRSFNIRAKRKEIREKSWKRNTKKNHSSSTESIDTEGMKQQNKGENDSDYSSQYILLDGLEPEDDEVPHRILRESSSTSNLEKHFSRRDDMGRNCVKLEKKVSEESSVGVETELLTPPPSPDKVQQDVRLNFAQIETTQGIDFVEVENMNDINIDGLSRSVKKIGGVIVECCDTPNAPEEVTLTSVEVLHSDDEILNTRSQMRRCSSLKTWKTPPGTPRGKKIVRFADALGLDLADVRTFLDEIPRIPSSAYEDLQFDLPKQEEIPLPTPVPTLLPLFQQPGNAIDFIEKVQRLKICLESVIIGTEGVLTVTGFIRVQNISFYKSVHVRYTINNWETYSDLQATYVPNSSDGFSDRFSFIIYCHTLKIGQKLEFALRLESCGAQYWDNNGGINYIFNCLPQTSSSGFFSSLCSQVDPWFDFY